VRLKTLSPEVAATDHARLRFQREAMIMATLNHPSVISIQELGDYNGCAFIACEWLDGRSLGQTMQSGLDLHAGLRIVMQVLDSLGWTHSRGVSYGAVNPLGIFVTKRGDAKLVDFSQATLLNDDQLRASAIEADLIGIGCVLDELVARTPKPEADSHPESTRETSSLASLRAVIDRAQQRKSGDCYLDALTMQADLQLVFNERYPNEPYPSHPSYSSAPPPPRTLPKGSSNRLHPRKGEVVAQGQSTFTWFHLLAILAIVKLLLLLTFRNR
jgi:serine/threonine protein kinase